MEYETYLHFQPPKNIPVPIMYSWYMCDSGQQSTDTDKTTPQGKKTARKMNASKESSIYSNAAIFQITSTTINLVLGVPINSWVLWLVLTGPAGTMASEFFTLDLSVCDIIFSLLCLPAVVTQIRLFETFTNSFLFTGRPLFQCCICVERFMAVVHPVLFLKYKPLRYRVACSVVAWLVIIGTTLLYGLVHMERHYRVLNYVYLGECLFFMSVMLLCSLAVLRALKQPRPGETGRETDNSMKRRAFIIICLIMVSFVGTFFIWCIILILSAQKLWLPDLVEPLVAACMFVTVVSGLLQPLLYLCRKTGKLPCVKPIDDT